MVRWSAPAKAILFGEHAVVYGAPALAVTLDRRVEVSAEPDRRSTVNGRPMTDRHHGYIKKALEMTWDGGPLKVLTVSDIPSAAGMGSSAAIAVASTAAGLDLSGRFEPMECARIAHRAECMEEGRPASPLDTSCCTFGSGLLVSRGGAPGIEPGGDAARSWEMPAVPDGSCAGEEAHHGPPWKLRGIDVPELPLVLGHTGMKGKTRVQVGKVRSFTARQKGFANDILREIGELTLEGVEALRRGDKARIGELMDRNDRLLGILGVSSPELNRLAEAARRHSYGAKMMGAGGGGCMIALTDEPEAVSEAIRKAGGEPIQVRLTREGVRKER